MACTKAARKRPEDPLVAVLYQVVERNPENPKLSNGFYGNPWRIRRTAHTDHTFSPHIGPAHWARTLGPHIRTAHLGRTFGPRIWLAHLYRTLEPLEFHC